MTNAIRTTYLFKDEQIPAKHTGYIHNLRVTIRMLFGICFRVMKTLISLGSHTCIHMYLCACIVVLPAIHFFACIRVSIFMRSWYMLVLVINHRVLDFLNAYAANKNKKRMNVSVANIHQFQLKHRNKKNMYEWQRNKFLTWQTSCRTQAKTLFESTSTLISKCTIIG